MILNEWLLLPSFPEVLLEKAGFAVSQERPESKKTEEDEFAKRMRLARSRSRKGPAKHAVPFKRIFVKTPAAFSPLEVSLPGDISLSHPMILGACLFEGKGLTIRSVHLEMERFNFINMLKRMGANIEWAPDSKKGSFKTGDLKILPEALQSRKVSDKQTLSMLHDIPFLAVAAAHAKGKTIIRDADLLRDAIPDILECTVGNLKNMQVKVGEIDDGLVVEGGQGYDACDFDSFGHFSVGAAFSVAALKCQGQSRLAGEESLHRRYPDFFKVLQGLGDGQ
jgi:3-phosphoshikimate 1-carboxyvinyltransferase